MDFSNSLFFESSDVYEFNCYGVLGILVRFYLNVEVYIGMFRYEVVSMVVFYIIDSGYYQLCGQGCVVFNLGYCLGVFFDFEQLEGYVVVFVFNNDGNFEYIFFINYDEYLRLGMNFL